MRWGIRYRLFVPLGLLLLGVVGISTWSAILAAQQAEERIAKQVKGVTHALAGTSIALTPRILEQMKGLSGADYLFLDANENRLGTLPNLAIELPSDLIAQPTDDDEGEPLGKLLEFDGKRFRVRRLAQRGGGNLFVLYPETSLDDAVRDAVRPAVIFGLVGGLAAMALMYFIGQRLVGRIGELERRTRQIAGGDFSPMPLPTQNDELRDLSQSVNEMAQRLAQFQETSRLTERFRLLGQLSSGLAHQLRNSVTGAKLAIQVHINETPDGDHEALQVALRQMNLMEANLRRFMDLGRSEPRATNRCEVADLIDEVLVLLGPQARHAGIELRWRRPNDDAFLEGDAAQLRDVFQNLIGNAIEAAGTRGLVEITLAHDSPGNVRIDVANTGPPPADAIAARLFDPFITGKPEGIGLGLTVARHAVEAHGGQLAWRRERQRTIFTVVLPTTTSVP